MRTSQDATADAPHRTPRAVITPRNGEATECIFAGLFRTYDSDVVNRRAERGEIWSSSNQDWLFGRDGYAKAAIHELGHALGLTHPWAPANPIPSSFPIRRGGTVMNNFFYLPPKLGESRAPVSLRDDFHGNIPLRPTICDIYGVVDAAHRQ